MYSNSLKTDPDLRITIVYTNYLFLTVIYIWNILFIDYNLQLINKNPADCLWTDPSVVGEAANPTYQGRVVVLAGESLEAFMYYVLNLNLPFSYDTAVGFYK